MAVFWIILALVVAGLLAKRYLIISTTNQTTTPPSPSLSVVPAAQIETDEDVDEIEITGESFYQPALIEIFGPYTPEGHQAECSAMLVPEPTNPHDKHAVRCEIEGRLVGYVNKTDVKSVARHMKRFKKQTLTVNVTVAGGWRRSTKDVGLYGVTAELPTKVLDPDA